MGWFTLKHDQSQADSCAQKIVSPPFFPYVSTIFPFLFICSGCSMFFPPFFHHFPLGFPTFSLASPGGHGTHPRLRPGAMRGGFLRLPGGGGGGSDVENDSNS